MCLGSSKRSSTIDPSGVDLLCRFYSSVGIDHNFPNDCVGTSTKHDDEKEFI